MASKKGGKPAAFPPARIKRIIQQDDEVGKVAQGTPVAVGRAVEVFLAHLVNAASEQASARNSNKVTLHHFKRAILDTPTFDFLKDQVQDIPDPVEKEDKPKSARKPRAPKDPNAPPKPRKKKADESGPSGGVGLVKEEEDQDSEQLMTPAEESEPQAEDSPAGIERDQDPAQPESDDNYDDE